MSVIVTDTGFKADDWTSGFEGETSLDLGSDASVEGIQNLAELAMVRIDFPSFADGRGFTLARLLRLKGYRGRLRAKGHVISDQYAMARRSGFDEVEIADDLAARQPEGEWVFRADWDANDYQSRVRG